MTISNQTCTITYTGNNIQTVFTYNFLIPYQSDGVTPAVAVYVIEDEVATLLAPSVYTITGVENGLGGTITYPLSGDPLTTDQQIQITRAVSYVQPYNFPNQGFYPQTVEELADWLVMQIQQIAAALGVTVTAQPQLEGFGFALTDETTEITATGTYVEYLWPYDWTLEEVQAGLTTASDGGVVTFTCTVNGTTVFSTALTIDNGDTSWEEAATAAVISNPTIPKGAVVRLGLSTVGASAAGAKMTLVGRQS